ncbi:uncharacterized protein LOC128201623 [Galleria mellonella]|uniref:Uncharacterized protein LOC128201623 n=1 Tax=Galleria mellonella TaxID=7137 RepID=A0ABM3MUU4_GALME|nr:uncharacterized protein LOC128201623 [Galleria mellonella]
MDLSRLMCDIQHSDSKTRRHFILSALKKDMKEYLTNTKVDTFLFGYKLAETIKSTEAVNKSDIDLKVVSDGTKNLPRRTDILPSRPLNRRAPAPARKQPGMGARFRQPGAARPLILPTQPAGHIATSWGPPPPQPPSPPPPTQHPRRRYYVRRY